MSIINDIFYGQYAPQDPHKSIPQDCQDEYRAFWEHIEEAIGEDYIMQHWECLSQREEYIDTMHFREGFILGVRLMMEVIGRTD